MDSSIFNGIAALDGGALDPAQVEDKVVLVVPCNQFVGQEPGSAGDAEVQVLTGAVA